MRWPATLGFDRGGKVINFAKPGFPQSLTSDNFAGLESSLSVFRESAAFSRAVISIDWSGFGKPGTLPVPPHRSTVQARRLAVSFGQTQNQQLRVQIRWLIRRDMAEVLEIEQSSFEFAWSEEHFLEYLRQRNCIGMVAEHNQQIVGFMIYELHKSRLRILNFAVAPWARRKGVGSQMVQRLVDKLAQQRREEIEIEIRETNLAGQLFYRHHHFRATEVIREFYEDTDEDAYRMLYRLDEPLDWVLPFSPNGRISFNDAA